MRRIALLALLVASPALAVPTPVTVRVLSQGAKFVGTLTGGVAITLKDAHTGEILARGTATGGTGSTALIMTDTPRNPRRADEKTAAFTTSLDLGEPRLIEVTATGPLAQPQSAITVTSQHWLIPGAPVIGDGWVVELPGLIVDVIEPVTPATAKSPIRITANIAMMCGCPIEPAGLWKPTRFTVQAHLTQSGKTLAPIPLAYANTTGRFTTETTLPPGLWNITVTATDTESGAVGLDRATLTAN